MRGKRSAARARAFAASSWRSRGGALVTRESNSSRAASLTRSTARTNAGSLILEGRVNPLSFLTNWRADARISSSVADGLKLWSVLMFRHMRNPPLDTRKLQTEHLSKPATGSYQDEHFHDPPESQ